MVRSKRGLGSGRARGDKGQAHRRAGVRLRHESRDGGKVLAARAGTVIWLAEQWPDDSHPPETPGEGNFIWIRHGDGTMAAPTGCPSSAASIRQARKAGSTCSKCHALFFAASANSHCPKGRGQAHTAWGDIYALVHDVAEAAGHQNGWRDCKNCAGLFFSPNISQSRCSGTPLSQGPHVVHGAPAYTVLSVSRTPPWWDREWRGPQVPGGGGKP